MCNSAKPEECTVPDHAQWQVEMFAAQRCDVVGGEDCGDGVRCPRRGALVKVKSPVGVLSARLCEVHQRMYKRRHMEVEVTA